MPADGRSLTRINGRTVSKRAALALLVGHVDERVRVFTGLASHEAAALGLSMRTVSPLLNDSLAAGVVNATASAAIHFVHSNPRPFVTLAKRHTSLKK